MITPEQAYAPPVFTPEQFAELRAAPIDHRTLDSAAEAIHAAARGWIGPADAAEPTALLLSGGVDSALMLALLAERGAAVHCYTAAAEDDGELAAARSLAERFGAGFTHVPISTGSVATGLPIVLDLLPGAGLWAAASGLLLDALLASIAADGRAQVWTGNGIDLAFCADPTEREQQLARRRAAPDAINVYGTIAAGHGLRLQMPFESFAAARLAAGIDAAVLSAGGTDKAPVRLLAERLGVPPALAQRAKDPFQRSSGMIGVLTALMYEAAAADCADQSSRPFDPATDEHLALRYFLALNQCRAAAGVLPSAR
jgi:asparagine synthetase B (glutamine-hydrolysing)